MTEEATKCYHDFESNYNLVLQHVNEKGELKLPLRNKETRRLAAWLWNQKRRKSMSDDERRKIDYLSDNYYEMTPRDKKRDAVWESYYEQLLEYKEVHKTFSFVMKDSTNTRLRVWFTRQRVLARQGQLKRWRKEALEEVGVSFNERKPPAKAVYTRWDEKWNEMYGKLCCFKIHHDHCNVPFYSNENNDMARLAIWVNYQRDRKKKGLLDEKRTELLEDIGFKWNIKK